MSKMLSVDEKSIKEFLNSGEKNSFLIPDYQRAYEWNHKQIEPLFDDLMDFTCSVIKSKGDEKYFLGTIVSYVNDEGDREIIDGQQRIVSLLLLLRAIYTKLSAQKGRSDDIEDRLKEIRTALWRRIKKTSSEVDYSQNYIRSESIDDNYQGVLQSILTTGKPIIGMPCNYSRNYHKLQTRYNELYERDQATAETFVYYLLNETIIFLIEADSRDAALQIFSTINNRGKPLSAANIFRAEMYKYAPDNEKLAYKSAWNKFVKRANSANKKTGVSVESIFSQYMYYLRAKDGDDDGTSIGVQTYFTQDKSKRLRDPNILRPLESILNIWAVIKKHETIAGEAWSKDVEILKILDIMSMFRDMSWRGAMATYYLKHCEESDFARNFRLFMRKLFSQYVPLYILYHDSTFLRECIFKLDIQTLKSNKPTFKFLRARDDQRLTKEMISSKYFQRMLLKAAAYAHPEQTELLPDNFTIEHVFNDDESIGNLTLIESKLSERLSKQLFDQKKNIYIESSIAMTRALIDEPDYWTPNAIEARSQKLAESLIKLWKKWSDDYDSEMH